MTTASATAVTATATAGTATGGDANNQCKSNNQPVWEKETNEKSMRTSGNDKK